MPPGRAGFGAAAGAGGVDRARTDRAGPGPVGLQIPPGVGGRRAAVGRLGGCWADVVVDGAPGGRYGGYGAFWGEAASGGASGGGL